MESPLARDSDRAGRSTQAANAHLALFFNLPAPCTPTHQDPSTCKTKSVLAPNARAHAVQTRGAGGSSHALTSRAPAVQTRGECGWSLLKHSLIDSRYMIVAGL